MAKKKQLKNWMIPYKGSSRGRIFIDAASAEEAESLADKGKGDWQQEEEFDCKPDGKPELNE